MRPKIGGILYLSFTSNGVIQNVRVSVSVDLKGTGSESQSRRIAENFPDKRS